MSGFFKSTLFILLSSLFAVSLVHAQGIPGVGTPFTLTLEPTNPKPGDTVTMTLESFSISLDKSVVTWTVDGKVVARGTGLKTASTVAGNLGSTKRVEVDVNSPDSGEFTQSAVIRPANLALVWQAATYVPPFYKGKALESFGATYKVVAIPEILNSSGRAIDPRTLIYSWKKNGANQPDQSGYGKDFFVSTQTSFVRQGDDISVDVTVPADGFSLSGNITVAPQAPEVHLYENSPLYGLLYNNELADRVNLTNEEVTISAEPYFFSVGSTASSLLGYSWTLNGASVSDFANKSSITLRRTESSAGSAEIGVSLTNSAKLLQGADKTLIIRYE